MKTFVKPGHEINFTLADSTTIASGEIVFLGTGLAGVSTATYVSGVGTNTVGVAEIVGVHKLPKTAGLVIAQGDLLYANTGTKLITKTNTDRFMGYADAPELAGSSTVRVLLARPGS